MLLFNDVGLQENLCFFPRINLSPWLQEEARKALEGALGGKKSEFEKWNKEIKRREEIGGGGNAGGGGWFGWGGRFGWSNDDNFWPEAQQTSLAVLGILALVSHSYPVIQLCSAPLICKK